MGSSEETDHGAAVRVRTLLRQMMLVGFAIALLYVPIGIVLRDLGVLVAAGSAVVMACVAAATRRSVRPGRVQPAVLLNASALLAVTVAVSFFNPDADVPLVLLCLLAVVLTLPYADARRARALTWAALLTVVGVSVNGVMRGAQRTLPAPLESVLVAVAAVSVVYLIGYHVIQTRDRLSEMLGAERQAVRRLEEANRTLEAVIGASPAAVTVLQPNGTLVRTNPAADRIFGWSALDGAGRRPPFIPEAAWAEMDQRLREVAAGAVIAGQTARWQTRAGDPIDVELWMAPVVMPEAKPLVLVIAVDVTARTRLEHARREHQRELSEAYERLRLAERRKDEFLAILGHELRNPLAPIATALELMRMSNGGAAHERGVIERQVRHMTRLVDDLLDVSRITSGQLELRRERLELSAVVQDALETAMPLLEERRHTVEVDVPEEGLVVNGDPTRLAQVVTNLLSNAAKYTEPGGHVWISARRAGAAVQLEVADDGTGMSPEMLSTMLEPFVQAPQQLDRPGGGLGLGLALVRMLTELHGGHVEAHSEGLGRGSTFTVTLPFAGAVAEAPREAAEPAPRPEVAPSRILVVDDNEDAADLISRALERRGFDVRTAYDGPQALRLLSDFEPDVAVLDIGLPVMDGYELAGRIRERFPEHPVRLVALTGYGLPSDRARSAAAGFDAHLVKPVDVAQLERALR